MCSTCTALPGLDVEVLVPPVVALLLRDGDLVLAVDVGGVGELARDALAVRPHLLLEVTNIQSRL